MVLSCISIVVVCKSELALRLSYPDLAHLSVKRKNDKQFNFYDHFHQMASHPSIESSLIMVIIQTAMGSIEVALVVDRAPITTTNFLRYVDNGFYNKGRFYRVVTMNNQPQNEIKIEVIQGGMNLANNVEVFPLIELERTSITGLRHKDGTISMARGEYPNSATSNFFICIGDQPELDFGGRRNPDGQGFAAFGQVIKGMDIVRQILHLPEEKQMLVKPVEIINIIRK